MQKRRQSNFGVFGRMVVLLMMGMATVAWAKQPPTNKPNIIFILADDLGYGDLGCYGQKLIQTPNIDKMANQGMKFTQYYAGSTVCAPSRCCLLTGKHSGHAWVRTNGNIQVRNDPEDMTVATILKKAGYTTAMIGKSGLGCKTKPGLANRKGFDHFFGYLTHTAAHHYYPKELYRNGSEIKYPNNHVHEGDNYSHQLFFEDTMDWLEANKKGPFFLHLSYQIPHASLRAPEQWKKKYRGQFQEPPKKEKGHYHYSNDPEPKTTYAAMVSRMDWEVGQILTKLKELGIDDNTIVFFSSDNGSMNEGGYQRKWFNSSGPLRGGKRDLYEGGIRVPLIVRWPGRIKPDTTSDHISAFWDFLATAADLGGAPIPTETDGISIVPTLLAQKQKQHDYLYWEFYEQGGKQAVRWGKWKGVRLNVRKTLDGPIQLFDLSQDIGETNNIADQHPDIVKQIAKYMKEAHTESPLVRLHKKK